MSSFVADKITMDGLTYVDVLLIPAYSEVLPKEVVLKTKFSRVKTYYRLYGDMIILEMYVQLTLR